MNKLQPKNKMFEGEAAVRKTTEPVPARILEGIRNGDEVAFAEYYEGIRNSLVAFITKLTGDEEESLNIAHDVLAKLWQRRQEITQLNGFVFTIATNTSLDLRRRRQVHKKYVDEQMFVQNAETLAPDEDMMIGELSARIEQVIGEMPPQRRKVYEMNRNEGLSYKEISEHLNISVETVKTHIANALSSIRSVITTLILAYLIG